MASVEYVSGPRGEIVLAQEGATAGSFVAGDLVKTNSSGQVILGTAGKIYGIARKSAAAVTGTVTPVELINVDAIYRIRYQTGATALTQVGALADITYTAGAHVVDDTTPTTNEIEIVGHDTVDAIGTSGGRLFVRFRPSIYAAR